MKPLITYTFTCKVIKNVTLTLQAHNEKIAWLELGELVYNVKNWELTS